MTQEHGAIAAGNSRAILTGTVPSPS
jgi:hypothetical protein